MCGEKDDLQWQQRQTLGSPPHVRGKEYIIDTDFPETGITPACAGKRKGGGLPPVIF